MWFWYAIAASVLWGIGYVINQVLMRTFSSIEILVIESIVIILVFVPWMAFDGNLKATLAKLGDVKIVCLVLVGSLIYILAAIFILTSISTSNASLAAVIESSYPLFTMIFAYILLREVHFSITSVVGAIFVITGLIIVHRSNQ